MSWYLQCLEMVYFQCDGGIGLLVGICVEINDTIDPRLQLQQVVRIVLGTAVRSTYDICRLTEQCLAVAYDSGLGDGGAEFEQVHT